MKMEELIAGILAFFVTSVEKNDISLSTSLSVLILEDLQLNLDPNTFTLRL
jgi:hypothetical protein